MGPGWTGRALAPSSAIDQVEHDLSTLRGLFERPDRHAVRGHAHYLLRLNDALRRSVTMRWARARSKWMPQDGMVRGGPRRRSARCSPRSASPRGLLPALRIAEVCDLSVPIHAGR